MHKTAYTQLIAEMSIKCKHVTA